MLVLFNTSCGYKSDTETMAKEMKRLNDQLEGFLPEAQELMAELKQMLVATKEAELTRTEDQEDPDEVDIDEIKIEESDQESESEGIK
mgnify:CR=1 FL=1